MFGNDPESIAARQAAREQEQAAAIARGPAPAPTPTISVIPLVDGPEVPPGQLLHIVDTLRHVGWTSDQEASAWINDWITLRNAYRKDGTKPSADDAEATLRDKWSFHYEDNLVRATEQLDRLFVDRQLREDLRTWLSTCPEFIEALYALAEREHNTGRAVTVYHDPDEGDASPEAFERRYERARENLRRLGIANKPLFTIS